MQIIQDFFIRHKLSDDTFVVGVSGGADSLGLVLMMKKELPGCKIIALTVNHNLRPSAYDEALYVAQIMEQYGIEHHILSWQHDEICQGIEEQARIARYRLMIDWCKKRKIKYLTVAHHLFDQAETFLMRLQRGSGLYGLSAMQEISFRDDVTILRPLLSTNPQTIKNYLNDLNISWIEDESNHCTDFLRVKMRKFLPHLMDMTGISPEKIGYASEKLHQSRDFIEYSCCKLIDENVHFWDDVGCSFDYATFCDWHNEMKFRVLAELIRKITSDIYIAEADSLQNLIEKIHNKHFESATLGGTIIEKSDLRLWVIRENRNSDITLDNQVWREFVTNNPCVRGIKIPYKLKIALLYKKI